MLQNSDVNLFILILYRAPLPPVAMTKQANIQRGSVHHPGEYTRRVSVQLPPYFSLNAVSLSPIQSTESNSPEIIAPSRADPSNKSATIKRQQRRGSLGTQSKTKTFQEALPRISPSKSKIRDMQLALHISSLRKSQDQVLPSIIDSNTNLCN